MKWLDNKGISLTFFILALPKKDKKMPKTQKEYLAQLYKWYMWGRTNQKNETQKSLISFFDKL